MDVVVHLGTCAIYILWNLELARCPLDHAHEPILDLFMILGGQTPKVANDTEGKSSRESLNQVAASFGAQGQEQFVHTVRDVPLKTANPGRRKETTHDTSEFVVSRRIHIKDVAWAVREVDHVYASGARERFVIPASCEHILVAGQRPDVPLRVMVERRFIAESPINQMRILVELHWVVVNSGTSWHGGP